MILVPRNIEIKDNDGSNATEYNLISGDNISIGSNANTSKIEANEFLQNGYNISFNAGFYDLTILDDSMVIGSGDSVVRSTFTVSFIDGKLQMLDVIINGIKKYDQDRTYANISFQAQSDRGVYMEGIGVWVIGSTFEAQ